MRYLLTLIISLAFTLYLPAQNNGPHPDNRLEAQNEPKKFDPERYQRELEAFITKEACLCPNEAKAFFPLLREMQKKQRAIYQKQKAFDKAAFTDNKAAEAVILAYDERELAIKKLQQQYHKQFVKVVPATKVLKAIHAEERFNRNMMRGFSRGNRPHPQNNPNRK